MIKRQVLLLAFFCLAARAYDIRHLELNDADLIDTSQTNYAITAPTLVQNNWKTVSVNGDSVVILTPSCQASVESFQALTNNMRTLISNARAQLVSIETGNLQFSQIINGQIRHCSSRFSFDGTQSRISSARNINYSSYQNNRISFIKKDNNNYSVAKADLLNLARIFVDNDVVTYVYRDGQVQMKPILCLQPAEKQQLQQLQLEANQAEQQLKSNIQYMQQNMHQNMQNMQQNMNNIFGNKFPFNQGNKGYMQQQVYPNQYDQQHSYNSIQNFASADNQHPYPVSSFGMNFPFRPNSSPFGRNFPFGPNNSSF